MNTKLNDIMKNVGVFDFNEVSTGKICFDEEVRRICASNTCRKYNTTWACPPAFGTVDECKSRCLKFENAIVYSVKYDLEDSFDFEGMTEGLKRFKEISAQIRKEIKPVLNDYLLLANEGCDKCTSCTYPDNPCRFPENEKGSLEGYGIFVNKLAESAGINYINGANTVTYFGAVFC